MRFVCTLPTGSGDVVWERSAAAAAAEEREGDDFDVWRKAEVAATAALYVVLWSTGWRFSQSRGIELARKCLRTTYLSTKAASAAWKDVRHVAQSGLSVQVSMGAE
jgi:hypothetical protein